MRVERHTVANMLALIFDNMQKFSLLLVIKATNYALSKNSLLDNFQNAFNNVKADFFSPSLTTKYTIEHVTCIFRFKVRLTQ